MTIENGQAARVRFLRAVMDMNQVDFASYVGVSTQSINMWESGYRDLTLQGARKLKAKTGYGLEFLLDGETSALRADQIKAWNEWLESESSNSSSV